jgi:ABC-type transporter lipoprotein component MlaA
MRWAAAWDCFTLLDLRAQTYQIIQGIQCSSVDYYASLRSLYQQLRNEQIGNGRAIKPSELPDF